MPPKTPFPIIHPSPSLGMVHNAQRPTDYAYLVGCTIGGTYFGRFIAHKSARLVYGALTGATLAYFAYGINLIKGYQRYTGIRENAREVEIYGAMSAADADTLLLYANVHHNNGMAIDNKE